MDKDDLNQKQNCAFRWADAHAIEKMEMRKALHRKYKTIPRWHAEMLHDHLRNEAYDAAIGRAVKSRPDSVVLDIGTGAGLTAMQAARAGAKHVYACEGDFNLALVARDNIQRNGLDHRITVLPKMSTELKIGIDIPQRAQLITTEIFDFNILGEHAIPTLEHAFAELAASDVLLVPRSAALYVVLAESEPLFRLRNVSEASGFDTSALSEVYRHGVFAEHIDRYAWRALSDPVEILRFKFEPTGLCVPTHLVDIAARETGTAHALVGWFDIELDDIHHIGSEPSRPQCHWKQMVSLLPSPRPTAVGEVLTITVGHDRESVYCSVDGA